MRPITMQLCEIRIISNKTCFHKIKPKLLQPRTYTSSAKHSKETITESQCLSYLHHCAFIVRSNWEGKAQQMCQSFLMLSGGHAQGQLLIVMPLQILGLTGYCCRLLLIYTCSHSSCQGLLPSLSSAFCNSASWAIGCDPLVSILPNCSS